MTALDVVSLEEMKKVLVVHPSITEFDDQISDLIASAVQWIEQYTCHILYRKMYELTVNNGDLLYYFPIALEPQEGVSLKKRVLSSEVVLDKGDEADITLNVGYDSTESIPAIFKTSVKRIVVYWYDMPEMNAAVVPNDVQVSLNQFRRSATI